MRKATVDSKPEELLLNIAGTDVVALRIAGKRRKASDMALYGTLKKPEYEEVELIYVPYYAWNNRGEGEMSVWVNYVF